MTQHAFEIVNFLDKHWCSKMAAHAELHPIAATYEETIIKLEALRRDFLAELADKPKEQVDEMVNSALLEQDLARPFHGFATEADYDHFGRCPFLTAYEAVAVSMGKDPRRVTWAMVEPCVSYSIFANEFANRLDRLERAIIWGELAKLFTPLQFLTWAHEYKMPVPQAFIDRTFVRGEPIHYWHDLCEALNDRLLAASIELEQERGLTSALNAEIEAQAQTFDDPTQLDRAISDRANENVLRFGTTVIHWVLQIRGLDRG